MVKLENSFVVLDQAKEKELMEDGVVSNDSEKA